jgi:3alpha(or 20beta)-hydroxysteroid dehydrogenase
MGKLDGRVVLVTGAARGQGEAEARLFVDEGARVVLADVLDERGERLAEELGKAARYVHLDVRREEDWVAAAEVAAASFGHLDGLVNNAGILRFGLLAETTLREYLDVVEVNQVGVFLGMRTVVPALTAAGGGTIVNTSSTSGLGGMPGLTAYTASKFAILGMTKVAAMELGPARIRVNAMCPGWIETPMTHPEQSQELAAEAAGIGGGASGAGAGTATEVTAGDRPAKNPYRRLPLRRIGQADEVAKLALFLTSDDSSYCTGAEFVVDGGMTAGSFA